MGSRVFSYSSGGFWATRPMGARIGGAALLQGNTFSSAALGVAGGTVALFQVLLQWPGLVANFYVYPSGSRTLPGMSSASSSSIGMV